MEERVSYWLNLTSLQGSEVILTSTFHFFFDKRPRQRSWFCQRFKNPSCRIPNLHLLPSVRLIFRSPSFSSAPGSLLGNITVVPHRRGTWQSKDVSVIIKEARDKNHLLITVEFDYGEQYQRYQDQLPSSSLPYLLVYANDLAISEPNSVAVSLQRYDPFIADQQPTQSPDSSPDIRVKRELDLDFSDPIDNNELPEVEYNGFKQHDMWESAYFALKPSPLKKNVGGKARSMLMDSVSLRFSGLMRKPWRRLGGDSGKNLAAVPGGTWRWTLQISGGTNGSCLPSLSMPSTVQERVNSPFQRSENLMARISVCECESFRHVEIFKNDYG